jgi:hypothetical protein
MAQSLPVAHLVVVPVSIYVVNSHLAVIFWEKPASLTVVFLVSNPRALNVRFSNYVLAVATVVLTLCFMVVLAFSNTHAWSADRTVRCPLIYVDVSEGMF